MSNNSVSTYACHCDGKLHDRDGIKQHLKDVHGIDIKTTKSTRRALVFMDGEGFAEQQYEIKIGSATIFQVVHIDTRQ